MPGTVTVLPPTVTVPVTGLPKGSLVKSAKGCVALGRIATEGTNPVKVSPRRCDFCSPSTKKKVLFFRIGPPIEPPYWFRLNFSGEVAKKLLASSEVLRRNSNSDPWKLLEPDFEVTSTVGPARVPYSAE